MLSVTPQTKVLEDSEGVAGGGTGALVSSRLEELSIQARTLSTTNMTSRQSVTAAVDDTTAIQDSCDLNHKRRAYFTADTRRSIRQRREDVAQKESTYVSELSAVNGGEVGDGG
jgi:hypothetical protein